MKQSEHTLVGEPPTLPMRQVGKDTSSLLGSVRQESRAFIGNAQFFLVLLHVVTNSLIQLCSVCDSKHFVCSPPPPGLLALSSWVNIVTMPMLTFCVGHSWSSEKALPEATKRVCRGAIIVLVFNMLATVRGDYGKGHSNIDALGFSQLFQFRLVDAMWYLCAILLCQMWTLPLSNLHPIWLCAISHLVGVFGGDYTTREHQVLSAACSLLPFFASGYICAPSALAKLHGGLQRGLATFGTGTLLTGLYIGQDSEHLRQLFENPGYEPIIICLSWFGGVAALVLVPYDRLQLFDLSLTSRGKMSMVPLLLQFWVYYTIHSVWPRGILGSHLSRWLLVPAGAIAFVLIMSTKRFSLEPFWTGDHAQTLDGASPLPTQAHGQLGNREHFGSSRPKKICRLISSAVFQQLAGWCAVIMWMLALGTSSGAVDAGASGPMQSCESMGGIVHPRMNNVCCAPECGVMGCGAPNCTRFPGGARGCCIGSIFKACGNPPCRYGAPVSLFPWTKLHNQKVTMAKADKLVACNAMDGTPHATDADICCPGTCAVCRGRDSCATEPGEKTCCADHFQNRTCGAPPCIFESAKKNKVSLMSNEDCRTGFPSFTSPICCAESCGACGGTGCAQRPGGWKACCSRGIKMGATCTESQGVGPCYKNSATAETATAVPAVMSDSTLGAAAATSAAADSTMLMASNSSEADVAADAANAAVASSLASLSESESLQANTVNAKG